MKKQVTVVPSDKLIIVEGIGYTIDFLAPKNIHAIQWREGVGHCEYVGGEANKVLTGEDYEIEVAPYVKLWENEKERIEKILSLKKEEYNKLENVISRALCLIDTSTSNAILAGFNYDIDGEVLHFSYDQFDQQNFADTANACLLSQSGIEGLPKAITWNGWKHYSETQKGELVRLVLDVNAFLTLYTTGALAHKATQMEIGGQRKAFIESCKSVEEVNAFIKEWGLKEVKG